MSVLPRCTIAMPTPCVLTCPAPTAATVSQDMSVWMTSPAQVSSQVQQWHSPSVSCVYDLLSDESQGPHTSWPFASVTFSTSRVDKCGRKCLSPVWALGD